MKITPETKSLATIFQIGSDNRYTVPVYQRNYSWRDEQIETLFDDIRNEDQGYYVGNLLINSQDGFNNIIDGQQRLTTLSLMLLASYEKLQEFRNGIVDNNDPRLDDIVTIQSDIKRQLLIGNDVRLTLLDKDQAVWENIVKVLNKQALGGWGRYFLFKRYKYIKVDLFAGLDDLDEFLAFYKKLTNVELLQISVPDLSDAYQVFASLNSKGMPLTPLDLMKNVYLSKNGRSDKWQNLQDLFASDEDIDTAKLTSFVLNNFDAFEAGTSSSLTKGKIVKAYEKIFRDRGHSYIDLLIERAGVYMKIANDNRKYDWSLSGLAMLDATTSYPLLLNILMN